MTAPVPALTATDAGTGLAAGPHQSKAPELKALTGVRAVAAAIVVISHIGVPAGAPEWVGKVAYSGYIGVPLFFLLSGFVLAYNYPDISLRDWRGTLRFYLARAARVLPLYYVVLGYLFVVQAAQDRAQPYLLQHVLQVQTWSGSLAAGQQTYNGPSWSINVELFFYALFPLVMPLVVAAGRRLRVPTLLALTAGIMAFQWALCILFTIQGWADLPATDPRSGHRWLYRFPPTRLPEFFIGILLAMLWARGTLQTRRYADLLQVGAVAVALALTVIRPWDGPHVGIWRVASFGALYSLPFAVLLLSLASGHGWIARLLSTRVMLSLGVASFAVYMTHRPFLEFLGATAVRESDDLAGWLLVPLLLGLTLVIGEGAHRYVEVPCRRGVLALSHKLLSR